MARHNRHEPLAVGIDVGTSKIAVCVGLLQDNVPTVLGMSKSASAGIRRGVVSEIEETISALSSALAQAERVAGVKITSAVIGIGGTHITTTQSKGIIAVNRPQSEITPEDSARAVEAAKAVALPPNQELLHNLPRLFRVDGLDGVKDPAGMVGIRLEVDTFIIGASTAQLRNMSRAATSAGLVVENLVFGPLAAANAILDKLQRESGVILVDIGAATTSFVVYEEDEVIHANVIPMGSSHITNDIAIGLRTNLEIAERVKQECAFALASEVSEDEIIELSQFDPTEETVTNRRYLCEIVEARVGELFSILRDELRAIGKDGMLPAGAVLTGGGARLSGIVEAAKEMLQLPARLGQPPTAISGIIDKLDDPLYATSVGLMLNGLYRPSHKFGHGSGLGSIDRHLSTIFDKAKNVLKHLLP